MQKLTSERRYKYTYFVYIFVLKHKNKTNIMYHLNVKIKSKELAEIVCKDLMTCHNRRLRNQLFLKFRNFYVPICTKFLVKNIFLHFPI